MVQNNLRVVADSGTERLPQFFNGIADDAQISVLHFYSQGNYHLSIQDESEPGLPCYGEYNKIDLNGNFRKSLIEAALKPQQPHENPDITSLRENIVKRVEDAKVFDTEVTLQDASERGFNVDGSAVGILSYD